MLMLMLMLILMLMLMPMMMMMMKQISVDKLRAMPLLISAVWYQDPSRKSQPCRR